MGKYLTISIFFHIFVKEIKVMKSIKKNGLPKVEHGSFLVYAPKSFPKNSRWMVAEYYDDVKGFYSESSENFLPDVTHWCELPIEPTEQ
jgi:hypothetical protein